MLGVVKLIFITLSVFILTAITPIVDLLNVIFLTVAAPCFQFKISVADFFCKGQVEG
jgi:hypothetical protein